MAIKAGRGVAPRGPALPQSSALPCTPRSSFVKAAELVPVMLKVTQAKQNESLFLAASPDSSSSFPAWQPAPPNSHSESPSSAPRKTPPDNSTDFSADPSRLSALGNALSQRLRWTLTA